MDLFNGHAFLGASVRLPLAMSTSRLCSHEQALASLYRLEHLRWKSDLFDPSTSIGSTRMK